MSPRVAIVTGASSGIGKAAVLALAARGFRCGIGYGKNREAADRVAADLVARARGDASAAWTFQLDLEDPAASADSIHAAADALGGLDVFVNNAGINRRAVLVEESLADWTRVLTVNATSPFACAQAAARRMIELGRGGRIINVTSVHELVPIHGGSAYCASKGALGLLTKVMALELAQYGITVNAISPGETATPMNGVPEQVDAAEIARPAIPVGRPGRPREVAALIAHLAEPDADYITGVSLPVDGGLMLMSAIANQKDAGGR